MTTTPPPNTPRPNSRRRLLIGVITVALALTCVVAGAAYVTTHLRSGTHGSAPPVRIRFGQREIVTAVWSPDGTRVASTSTDAAVRVWDAATGKLLLTCTLAGAGTGVFPQSVVWSADGRSLLAFFGEYLRFPSNDQFEEHLVNLVQVWDAETGQPVRSFHVLPPATITGAISEAGKSNAYAHVRGWAMNERYLAVTVEPASLAPASRLAGAHPVSPLSPTPTPLTTPTPPPTTASTPPTQPPTPVPAVTPTPGPLPTPTPSTSPSEIIEIWDLATGSKVATLDPGRQSGDTPPTAPNAFVVMGLVWAPHGGNLAVNVFEPQGNLWQVWDITTRKVMRTFPVVYGAETILAWSPDARSLAAGTTIYDVATGSHIATYPPAGTLVSQAWSPDGKRLAVSWYAATQPGLYTPRYSVLSLIDTATGKVIAQYDQGENSALLGDHMLAWSPNGKELLVVRDGAEIWRMG